MVRISSTRLLRRQVLCILVICFGATGAVYEVGPAADYAAIGDVPWESLEPGDRVLIHWRAEPYREKWVICRSGTESAPIVVSGVLGPEGQYPVIDGQNAVTRPQLNFWGEARGVIKIGGANTPEAASPQYVVVENLAIRNGRPPFTFSGRRGVTAYRDNCAAIYVETGAHVTVRNCVLHDSANGLLVSHAASEVLVEHCEIRGNGMPDSMYQHNVYTEANGIVFQFNRLGQLRTGANGNNLKDRSAGTVVRYNWIHGGSRLLDLVDSSYKHIYGDPTYRETFVYGNVLIKDGRAANNQICHYGGDSTRLGKYRNGTLYFVNNTVISRRPGNTTVFRLSTPADSSDCRNNIFRAETPGARFRLVDRVGTVLLRHNWLQTGTRIAQRFSGGSVKDLGGQIMGSAPGFRDPMRDDFDLSEGSECIDAGTTLPEAMLPDHAVRRQYRPHCARAERPEAGPLDLGAFEFVPVNASPLRPAQP